MPTVTLLAKIYNSSQVKLVEKNLSFALKGLKFKAKILGTTSRGWVQIEVSGEDESVALGYLANEIGLCPESMANVQKFSTLKGRIVTLNKNYDKLRLDAGIFSPDIVDAEVPLRYLQAQLVDGRKTALRKIVELYGFHDNLSLTVKVVNVDKENNLVEAMLAEKQASSYGNWTKSLLDRLIVLGASLSEVRRALEISGFNRDVVIIESLGMFEHVVVCKLGTDAKGLIPRIGKILRNALFAVFNPKKILEFLDDSRTIIS